MKNTERRTRRNTSVTAQIPTVPMAQIAAEFAAQKRKERGE